MVAEDEREIGPRETSQASELGIIVLEEQPGDGREYNLGRMSPPPSKRITQISSYDNNVVKNKGIERSLWMILL